jgi:hypothetical protein
MFTSMESGIQGARLALGAPGNVPPLPLALTDRQPADSERG